MKTILIVEDDPSISNLIDELLISQGYQIIQAYSGTEAQWVLQHRQPDLILLDLMLPGIQGEAVLALAEQIPVIVVSARCDLDDKVQLLRSGAVDYITKPFEPRELLARIEVQLRPSRMRQEDVLTCGMLTLKPLLRQAFVGKQSVKLTRTETAILKLLMLNPGQVIPKSQMLDQISEDTPDGMENSLKVHISHLRSKLRTISEQEMIESVWGIGFRIHPQS